MDINLFVVEKKKLYPRRINNNSVYVFKTLGITLKSFFLQILSQKIERGNPETLIILKNYKWGIQNEE